MNIPELWALTDELDLDMVKVPWLANISEIQPDTWAFGIDINIWDNDTDQLIIFFSPWLQQCNPCTLRATLLSISSTALVTKRAITLPLQT